MVRPPKPPRAGILAAALRALAMLIIVAGSVWLAVDLLTTHHRWLYDFRGGLYDAGRAILHGRDPYRADFIAHQAAIMHAGAIAIGETAARSFSLPVYPAPANLAMVPFSLLPYSLAAILFTASSVAALVLALWLLEVRDWRCYVLALISWPFTYGLDLGALGPLLVLGVAVIWRWRDRILPPALAVASIVIAKVFPFPLAIWLLMTRRYRQFALALVLGLAITFGAWAVLGFAGLTAYPAMLSNLSFIQEGRSDSLVAALLAVGMPAGLAQALAFLTAGALLILAWRFARTPGGQRQSFGLTVMAALTASPIVWDHYLVLLLVPVALLSPRWSRLWLLPLAAPVVLALTTVVVPFGRVLPLHSPHNTRMALITVCLEALLVARLCRMLPGTESRASHTAGPAPAPPSLASA
jgi:hypothetical protein